MGLELCAYLSQLNCSVTAITRKNTAILGCLNKVVESYCNEELAPMLSDHHVVVHLAAKTHQSIGGGAKNLQEYRQVNVDNTRALAKAALAVGVKRFIYISSIKVNGEVTHEHPFSSEDIPNPRDAYGRSKWEAECELRQLFTGSLVELVIIRPPLVWGEGQKGNLALIERLLKQKAPLPFKGFSNKRDLISKENLCAFIGLCIFHSNAANELFLVCDGYSRSTSEIVSLMAQLHCVKDNQFYCPKWIFSVLKYIPAFKSTIDKLTGDLRVDQSTAYEKLGWRPLS